MLTLITGRFLTILCYSRFSILLKDDLATRWGSAVEREGE